MIQRSTLLFLGGVGLYELFIVLIVGAIMGFFVWRPILARVLRKGPGAITMTAIVGGILTAPTLLLFLALGFWLFIELSAKRLDTGSMRADTTRTVGYEPTPETSHPNARTLFEESFYWSVIGESTPFGNDAGADALSEFSEWRIINASRSPVEFLHELFEEWGYDQASLLDPEATLEQIIGPNPSVFVIEADQAIIAVGFGQYLIEGKIDEKLQQVTNNALIRELNPKMIMSLDEAYQADRRRILLAMLEDLDKMGH